MRKLIKRNLAMTGTLLLAVTVQFGQIAPLKYGDIITALSARLPAGMTKQQLVENLIQDVRKRGVDRPLTQDIEDLLRQAGATTNLINVIRQNGPTRSQSGRDKSSQSTESAEVLFWRMIENSNEISEVQNYITRVERGEFAGRFKPAAELKLARLKRAIGEALWTKHRGLAKSLLSYDEVGPFVDGIARIKLGDRYGYIDRTGNQIIPPGKYDSISPFSDGLAVVQNGSDEDIRQGTAKFGFVDKTGKEVVAVGTYSLAYSFSEGVAAVLTGVGRGARYTFIDRSGREVPRLGRYVYAESFSNGFARVNPRGDVKNGYGFIDLDGKEIVPPRYDSNSEVLSAGLIRVCRQVEVAQGVTMRCGVVDKSGKEIVPFGKYSFIHDFSDGLALVTIGFNENKQSGFIDELGNEFISPGKFPGGIGRGFFEGYLVACATTTNCFLIDRTGKRIASLPPKMTPSDYFDDIREGMIRFSSGSEWGFIDRSGSVIVPAKYDFVSRFSDGVSFVCVSRGFRECGFIEKSGKQLTPLKYDHFINDEFLKHYQINAWILGRDIESVFVEFEGALQQVRVGGGENGKWGFIDRTGREIVSPKYEKVWCRVLKKEGLVGVVLDGRKGFVDRYGNEYFDF